MDSRWQVLPLFALLNVLLEFVMFLLNKGRSFSSIETAESMPEGVRSLSLWHKDIEGYVGRFAQFERLEVLDISWCQSGARLPEDIGTLRHLRILEVLNVSLQLFPEWIGALPRLQRLVIRGTDIRQISPNIQRCTRLNTINFGNNSLQSVPPELGRLRLLRQLDLPDNPLSSLPDEILALPKLRRLGLANTHFSQPEVKRIKARFPNAAVWATAE